MIPSETITNNPFTAISAVSKENTGHKDTFPITIDSAETISVHTFCGTDMISVI